MFSLEFGSARNQEVLLGILSLSSVNVELSIWHSQIEVGEPNIGEAVREVVGPELVYCQDHNLLMYSKGVLPATGRIGLWISHIALGIFAANSFIL